MDQLIIKKRVDSHRVKILPIAQRDEGSRKDVRIAGNPGHRGAFTCRNFRDPLTSTCSDLAQLDRKRRSLPFRRRTLRDPTTDCESSPPPRACPVHKASSLLSDHRYQQIFPTKILYSRISSIFRCPQKRLTSTSATTETASIVPTNSSSVQRRGGVASGNGNILLETNRRTISMK